jgi:ATP-binding cassette subfamily C protein CydD
MIAVTIGFRLFWGELDFSIGFMLLLLAPEYYLPFRNLGAQYHAKMKGVAAAEQMLAIMETTPRHSGEQAFNFMTDTAQPTSSQTYSNHALSNNTLINKFKLDISYHNLSFNYPDGRKALKDISLSIKQPGLYAIIGPSGAGKSTLIDLLLAFLPAKSGQIIINGQDLANLKRAQWQKNIAWVPQNPQLFFGSILENIQIADPSASSEQVMIAARKAGVDQFIDSFKDGYQHIIQEQGVGISGGQRQRIAMARVFLKQAPLLILDEPSAHLDAQTQQWLTHTLAMYAKQHYVLVVAHKLHTIKNANTIFLLNQGELAASGSHQQLLQQSALYNLLLNAQTNPDEMLIASKGV